MDSYFAGARKTQEDTLKVYILSKIEACRSITQGDKIWNTDRHNNNTNASGRQKYWIYWILGSNMEFTILLPIGQYILRDPTMTTVFYSRPTVRTTATRNSKVHGSHSENCNKRDLQNTFNIQSPQISKYLNYNTHTSPWSMLPKYLLILQTTP